MLRATITGQKNNEVKYVCHMSIMVNTLHEWRIWQPRKDRNMRSQPEISFSILVSNLPMTMAFSFVNCYCDHIMSNFKSFQVAHRDSVYTDKGPTQRLAWPWGGVGSKDFFGLFLVWNFGLNWFSFSGLWITPGFFGGCQSRLGFFFFYIFYLERFLA